MMHQNTSRVRVVGVAPLHPRRLHVPASTAPYRVRWPALGCGVCGAYALGYTASRTMDTTPQEKKPWAYGAPDDIHHGLMVLVDLLHHVANHLVLRVPPARAGCHAT
jgi:hypothetical protein